MAEAPNANDLAADGTRCPVTARQSVRRNVDWQPDSDSVVPVLLSLYEDP
jgi:hypothetical protein